MRVYWIPFISLCFLLIAVPASAQIATYTAEASQAVSRVDVISKPGTSGTITFAFQDGTTKTSTWSYLYVPNAVQYPYDYMATVNLDGDTATREFITPGNLHTIYEVLAGAGVFNITNNRIVGYIEQSAITFELFPMVETKIGQSPVVGFTINADSEISYDVDTISRSEMSSFLKAGESDWIYKIMSFAQSVFFTAYNFLTNLLYWLKFFFIDNIGLTLSLYLSVSMALAARAARGNIGRFLRTFISDQRKLFSFIIEVWRMLIESIGTIRGWFRI